MVGERDKKLFGVYFETKRRHRKYCFEVKFYPPKTPIWGVIITLPPRNKKFASVHVKHNFCVWIINLYDMSFCQSTKQLGCEVGNCQASIWILLWFWLSVLYFCSVTFTLEIEINWPWGWKCIFFMWKVLDITDSLLTDNVSK